MNSFNKYYPIAGRVLLSAIFLFSALGKIGQFEQTAGYMASHGMPMTGFFLTGAIFLLITGSLSILTGFKARWGAALLIVFLIPATLIFHNFWALEGMEARMQMIMFMKNLAITGGLLTVIAHGSGAYSLDNLLSKSESGSETSKPRCDHPACARS